MSDELQQWPNAFLKADEMDGPHGWIQWKGTDVCMDVRCSCGETCHLDGDFAYWLRCGACGQVFVTGCNVRLYPVSPEWVKANEHRMVSIKEAAP